MNLAASNALWRNMQNKVALPDRKPDLVLTDKDEPIHRLELWLDECVERYSTDDDETHISPILFKDGTLYYNQGNKGRWEPYNEDTYFSDVAVHVGNFIDKILFEENTMLTDTQKKYIELEKKKQEYKVFLEEFKEVTSQLHKEMGLGGHFQDAEGTVYQIFEAEGRFVHFDKFEVKRTRREGERAGSLAITKAKELGYDVK